MFTADLQKSIITTIFGTLSHSSRPPAHRAPLVNIVKTMWPRASTRCRVRRHRVHTLVTAAQPSAHDLFKHTHTHTMPGRGEESRAGITRAAAVVVTKHTHTHPHRHTLCATSYISRSDRSSLHHTHITRFMAPRNRSGIAIIIIVRRQRRRNLLSTALLYTYSRSPSAL